MEEGEESPGKCGLCVDTGDPNLLVFGVRAEARRQGAKISRGSSLRRGQAGVKSKNERIVLEDAGHCFL